MCIYDLVVIGAGPAGIMGTITAAREGARVALLEKNQILGRKLLSTGNGRCNICNWDDSLSHFHGASSEFIEKTISQFDRKTLVHFFEDLGLVLNKEERGRMFPRTNQASSVAAVLAQEIKRLGVATFLNCHVNRLERKESWEIVAQDDSLFVSEQLLIATGGRAAHQLGSTGEGLGWANRFGHTIVSTYPALVPLVTLEPIPQSIQGLKILAKVQYTDCQGRLRATLDDLHFTSYGISGPAAMSLARYMAPALKNDVVKLTIDLLPDIEKELLLALFYKRINACLHDVLVGILPDRLAKAVLDSANIGTNKRISDLQDKTLEKLIAAIKSAEITITKLRPYKDAQVTKGGIDTTQIDAASMKSKLVENLYFAGEIVDVDADSGGYNLHWAWASGYTAGLLR